MADDGFYDGVEQDALAERVGVPLLRVFGITGSTQDDVHRLATAGAPGGTIVLADEQTAGRGRAGKRWTSGAGDGIWLSLLERPTAPDAIDVLSLRLGLFAARVLDRFTGEGESVRLKWPNDLFVRHGKLAGVLVEARWRNAAPHERRLDWVTIGIGVNVRRPDGYPGAGSLQPGTSRVGVLESLIPALRSAAGATGALTPPELAEYRERDLARGQRCRAPERGVVEGISAAGALIVHTDGGRREHRGGSLILEGDAA